MDKEEVIPELDIETYAPDGLEQHELKLLNQLKKDLYSTNSEEFEPHAAIEEQSRA